MLYLFVFFSSTISMWAVCCMFIRALKLKCTGERRLTEPMGIRFRRIWTRLWWSIFLVFFWSDVLGLLHVVSLPTDVENHLMSWILLKPSRSCYQDLVKVPFLEGQLELWKPVLEFLYLFLNWHHQKQLGDLWSKLLKQIFLCWHWQYFNVLFANEIKISVFEFCLSRFYSAKYFISN